MVMREHGWQLYEGIPSLRTAFNDVTSPLVPLLPTVGVVILCKQVITKPLDWVTLPLVFGPAGALLA